MLSICGKTIILLDTMSYRIRTNGMRFAQQTKYLCFSKEEPNSPGKALFGPMIDGSLYWQRTVEGSKPDIVHFERNEMIVYKVFYKDCYRKKIVLLGTLTERRKDLRGMSYQESGSKWAKFVFGDKVSDIKRIIVVPKEMNEAGNNGIIFSNN
jgi:hypothetical protein